MVAHKAGGAGGSVPFVGASPPSSPSDGELWWDTDDDTAVGAQGSTATVTVTTDPNTFTGSHVCDLGHGGVPVALIATLTATDGDGETFDGSGVEAQVFIEFSPDADFARELSSIDYPWLRNRAVDTPAIGHGATGDMTLVGDAAFKTLVSSRYLRVTVEIWDNNTFLFYAGANHPTASVRVDLEYV